MVTSLVVMTRFIEANTDQDGVMVMISGPNLYQRFSFKCQSCTPLVSRKAFAVGPALDHCTVLSPSGVPLIMNFQKIEQTLGLHL